MSGKLNARNCSLFLGILGFVSLFLLFCLNCCTIDEQGYSFYSLFFTLEEYSLFPICGPLFFVVFMINFLLYLALLVLRILKKDSRKTLWLGQVGMAVSVINVFALFGLIFAFEGLSDLILVFITSELIGLIPTYAAWNYACRKHDDEENGLSNVNAKRYVILSIIELLFFVLPFVIIICIFGLLAGGKFGATNKANYKPVKEYKYNKTDSTILANNKKYSVKGNKLYDIQSNKEVGYLEGEKVFIDTKED